jgi:hypothetical protein
MSSHLNVVVIVVLVLAAGFVGALVYGASRSQAGIRDLRARLEAARVAVQPQSVHFRELDDLPAPVQRYFRKVLKDGQPMLAGVDVRHRGTMNLGQTGDQWKPFTSDQRVLTRRPGFLWNARIAMLPGLPVLVHDAYVAGEGILHGALLGLFPVVNLRGTAEMAKGELMRFFAEAAWYPTALLPSQGVRWERVDDRSARGTLTDGAISLTMLFTFNEQDLIDRVLATRGRAAGGKVIPTPWECRYWNYDERGGRWVPLDGEAAWLLPGGVKPYFRGRISEIVYQFAR